MLHLTIAHITYIKYSIKKYVKELISSKKKYSNNILNKTTTTRVCGYMTIESCALLDVITPQTSKEITETIKIRPPLLLHPL